MTRKIISLTGAAAAATVLGLAACGTASTPSQQSTSSAPPASSNPSAPPANPSATGTGSCDYTLGKGINDDNFLIGNMDVTNTGNVGVTTQVTIAWPQEGYAPITSTKTVQVPFGAKNMAVPFHVNAGNVTNSNVVDRLQSWVSGHNYPTNPCTYAVKVVGTYGTVHG